MGFLLRLYVDALLEGNPVVVLVTVVAAVALAAGPFHEGLSRRDPAAIAIVAAVALGVVVLLVIAIDDRKLNPPQGKGKKMPKGRR